jgi:hypothetical protein
VMAPTRHVHLGFKATGSVAINRLPNSFEATEMLHRFGYAVRDAGVWESLKPICEPVILVDHIMREVAGYVWFATYLGKKTAEECNLYVPCTLNGV